MGVRFDELLRVCSAVIFECITIIGFILSMVVIGSKGIAGLILGGIILLIHDSLGGILLRLEGGLWVVEVLSFLVVQ